MKDVLIFFLFMLVAFPFGMAFAAFLRRMSKQKRDERSRQAMANSWPLLGRFGVPFNLMFAAMYAVQHNWNQVLDRLIQAAFFAVAFFGAWAETRRFRNER